MSNNFSYQPIAIVHSCFTEKFGTPRQPGVNNSATATIELLPPYNDPEAFEGLENFSHIWVIFSFHKHRNHRWTPKVRPPRLGGNKRIGVFATRSSFRPNSLGLSALKLEKVESGSRGVYLTVSGQDLIDGTPILDIKPYIQYADSIPSAFSDYAQQAPAPRLQIVYSEIAKQRLQKITEDLPAFEQLLIDTISYDPRPQYHASTQDGKSYGMKLMHFEVKFSVTDNNAIIETIEGTG